MNSIQKKKGALIGIAIAALILGLAALVGGIILVIFGAKNLVNQNWVAGGLMVAFGGLLVVLGLIGGLWGIRYIWVGSAIKATKGPIAEENLAMNKEGKNVIRCPKCGCANSVENKVCSNCEAPLQQEEEKAE